MSGVIPQDLTAESQAWEFCPGFETPESYDAFQHYRDTGPAHRTLARTARDLGIGPGTVYRWAQQYLWADRVLSYDAHREAERASLRKAAEGRVDAAWAETRADLLRQLHELTDLGIGQLLTDLRQRRTRLRPNELRQLTETLIKWSNLANGDLTEKVDSGLDLSQLSGEQLAALGPVLRGLAAGRTEDDGAEDD